MKRFIAGFLIFIALGCSSDSTDDTTTPDTNPPDAGFDRSALLVNWADNIIIPAFDGYTDATAQLSIDAQSFEGNTSLENLNTLRTSLRDAYKAFQWVSPFNLGKAEELQLHSFSNIYPTDVNAVDQKAAGADYDLSLPSSFDEQGYPALDYLLYGTGDTDAEVIAFFDAAPQARTYLVAVASRLDDLAQEVLVDWQNGFRESYIDNDGSSATGSFNKTVNKYIEYYERYLRSGKIGIPAGALSGNPSPDRVEAFYMNDFSKALFLEGLATAEDFFKGRAFLGGSSGPSLLSALENLDNAALATDIEAQFELVKTRVEQDLKDSFSAQVMQDNSLMLRTRDNLQVNTILFKNDMASALNITITVVDNDGD